MPYHFFIYQCVHVCVCYTHILYAHMSYYTYKTNFMYAAFFMSEITTYPGGPRHKPFGDSRGSPRSQY